MSVDDAHGVLLVPPEQLELPSAAAFAFAVGPDTGRGLLDPAAWPEWAVIWYSGPSPPRGWPAVTAVAGRQKFAPDDQITAYQRRMRHLGLLVVLPSSIVHCLAPCQQLGRYVWWDTALCSILVSRGLTVIAELCLVAQVATGLLYCENEIFRAKYGPSDPGNFSWHFLTQGTVKAMIFLAVVAQGFSICGTATQRYLWFACKEDPYSILLGAGLPAHGARGRVRLRRGPPPEARGAQRGAARARGLLRGAVLPRLRRGDPRADAHRVLCRVPALGLHRGRPAVSRPLAGPAPGMTRPHGFPTSTPSFRASATACGRRSLCAYSRGIGRCGGRPSSSGPRTSA
ncbi:unnamed protein product [Prorocentrum cordatum]|nr:unnamed protein product [Polarella glacialis]